MLPKVIVSSVIRGTEKGESHGGVYLVDLETDESVQVIDWNKHEIDWSGRGGERGLRGIALFGDEIYMAANDEIMVFDRDFHIKERISNSSLGDIHEIHIESNILVIASTKSNTIVSYDLATKQFERGHHFRFGDKRYWLYKRGMNLFPRVEPFDPNVPQKFAPEGPDSLHINNVHLLGGVIHFSGSRLRHLYALENGRLSVYAKVPFSAHNARPFHDQVLIADTGSKQAALLDKRGNYIRRFPVQMYNREELLMSHLSRLVAQQGFARGLEYHPDGYLIVGSSPATVNLFDFASAEKVKAINLSKDIRNTIHGLAIVRA